MSAEKIFVGRKAELEWLKEILKNPKDSKSPLLCYKALLKIAKKSGRSGHEVEAINLNQPIGIIEPAISAGLVKVENGKVGFKDEHVWLYAVCEYLVCNVLLRAWEDDKKLWAAMRAIYLRGYRINYDALAANAVEVLHNRHGMDVIKRVGELC